MRTPLFSTFNRYLRSARRWYETTPERALDQAYEAVLMIRAIESEYFAGGRISIDPAHHSMQYSQNTLACLQADLKNYLKIAELRLSEFRASRFILSSTDFSANPRSGSFAFWNRQNSAEIIEKLKFIDEVLDHYQEPRSSSVALVPVTQAQPPRAASASPNSLINRDPASAAAAAAKAQGNSDGILEKTGVLPRTIVMTLNRIKRDLDPNSEEEVVQTFRNRKAVTLISIRFLLLLIIVPLLTQQLSKTLIISPVVEYFRTPTQDNIFLNFELEERALQELQTYKERLEFDSLLPKALHTSEDAADANPAAKSIAAVSTPDWSIVEVQRTEEQNQALLKAKVEEIARAYYWEGSNAIKNVFADIAAVIAFMIVIATNRREVAVLKTFIDETIYGLSDSAKAFIIILFTDMFVGFHSPHGWEVILEGVSKHFGLPPSRDFIFLFIATFPVILDTIFKYWIFRYLNRISPSAVATYRNMNES